MSARKSNKYRDLIAALDRISASLRQHAAPAGFADRVLERLEQGRVPAPAWGLRPALAVAGVLGALTLVFLPAQEPDKVRKAEAKPQILSFTVDKAKVGRSEPITLRWKVANVKRVQVKRSDGMLVGELTINRPVQSDSITLYGQKPGKYSFVLVALTADANRPTELD